MTVKAHLTEPWGIVAAILLGGMGGAVAAAVGSSMATAALVGMAIGGSVYGIKVGLAVLLDRARAGARDDVPDDARPWLARAAATVAALRDQARRTPDANAAALLTDAAARALAATDRLRRRAGALAVVDTAIAPTDIDALRSDHGRMLRALTKGPPDGALRVERQAAARALSERIAAHQRLVDMRALLLANMESTVLRLEAVTAQASVLRSLHATSETTTGLADLTSLADELDAARLGLEETEDITRQLLGEA